MIFLGRREIEKAPLRSARTGEEETGRDRRFRGGIREEGRIKSGKREKISLLSIGHTGLMFFSCLFA